MSSLEPPLDYEVSEQQDGCTSGYADVEPALEGVVGIERACRRPHNQEARKHAQPVVHSDLWSNAVPLALHALGEHRALLRLVARNRRRITHYGQAQEKFLGLLSATFGCQASLVLAGQRIQLLLVRGATCLRMDITQVKCCTAR
jgi:hypothetical protein